MTTPTKKIVAHGAFGPGQGESSYEYLRLNEDYRALQGACKGLADQVEALTKERDSALEQNTVLDARCAKLEAAGKLALDALSEYANPNNWDEDFHGVKRKWLEPDSNTRNGYSGFELAQKATKEAGVQ